MPLVWVLPILAQVAAVAETPEGGPTQEAETVHRALPLPHRARDQVQAFHRVQALLVLFKPVMLSTIFQPLPKHLAAKTIAGKIEAKLLLLTLTEWPLPLQKHFVAREVETAAVSLCQEKALAIPIKMQ